MPLVLIGVLMLVCKLADIGPLAHWPWFVVLAPFGLAVVWWQFSDATGGTQRKAMDRMEERKAKRRERAMEGLGLDPHREKQVARAREDAAIRRKSADPTEADATAAEDAEPRRDASR
jgi:small Trp-rich protein